MLNSRGQHTCSSEAMSLFRFLSEQQNARIHARGTSPHDLKAHSELIAGLLNQVLHRRK